MTVSLSFLFLVAMIVVVVIVLLLIVHEVNQEKCPKKGGLHLQKVQRVNIVNLRGSFYLDI